VIGLLLGALLIQTRESLPLFPAGSPLWLIALAGLLIAMLAIIIGRTFQVVTAAPKYVVSVWMSVTVLWLLSGSLLGTIYAQHRAELRLADQLSPTWEGRDIDLYATIIGLPALTDRGVRFLAKPVHVETAGAQVPGLVSLNWYSETLRKTGAVILPPQITPGEVWRFTVRLRRPHGTANPHGFDYEAYALERNIRATGYIRAKGDNHRISTTHTHDIGWQAQIDALRHVIREKMLQSLQDAPYRGVLIALAIGDQNAIPTAQWKTFWRSGTGHLMSISGLHITMVAALIYWLAFRLWAHLPMLTARVPAQRAAAVAGATAALGYSLLAGFSVPTQRTFFMLLAVAIALLSSRKLSATMILSISLLAVILIDPWAVLAPGFWLSFGAVAMIFYVTTYRAGQQHIWKMAFSTQWAVTLGLLPMTLFLFQEVSLVSPIANAIAIPLVSYLVVPLTLLGALLPASGVLELAHMVMSVCGTVLAWLANLPNAVWQSHAPVTWTIAFALIGMLCMLMPLGAGIRIRMAGLCAMLPMFFVLPPKPQTGELWMTLLDVGQGLSIVLRTENYSMVFDTGSTWNPDADSGSRIVIPYLRGEGIRKLDALIVSHDDDDHAGGAASIIDARQPAWVLTSLAQDRAPLANALEVMRCERGDRWHWDDVAFEVLHPSTEDYENELKHNDMSCVLKITAAGGSVLLTADIERRIEANLVTQDTDALRADVLLVPHHGSKSSSTDEFLDTVQPRIALLPVGYRNRFGHPHRDVMARYEARGIKVHRTDWEGALTLKFSADAKGVPTIESHRRVVKRYWHSLPLQSADVE
jgi:competence protein ComEC